MIGVREDWFATSVWYFDVPQAPALGAALLPLIRAERARDPEGLPGRCVGSGWHSREDLHRHHAFAPLEALVCENAAEVARFERWDLDRVAPAVTAGWALLLGREASLPVHHHPGAVLSGAYYLSAPEACGGLLFADPRERAGRSVAPRTEYTPWTFEQVLYPPVPGRMVIYPGWLPHAVEPNRSEGERISIGFTVGVRARAAA